MPSTRVAGSAEANTSLVVNKVSHKFHAWAMNAKIL